jgi:hypothetical protein
MPAFATSMSSGYTNNNSRTQSTTSDNNLNGGGATTTTTSSPIRTASNDGKVYNRASISILETTITKGVLGLGLDVTKNSQGSACIMNFKAMSDGSDNPCITCKPPLRVGDVIIAVNGSSCPTFTLAVQALKACPQGPIKIGVQRKS